MHSLQTFCVTCVGTYICLKNNVAVQIETFYNILNEFKNSKYPIDLLLIKILRLLVVYLYNYIAY